MSVKGGAVMTTRHTEAEADAEQRERQARIEQDIRQLFARYRRSETGKRGEPPRPTGRFVREAERTIVRSS
jgi:transcription elongation GreA/GreB family factor